MHWFIFQLLMVPVPVFAIGYEYEMPSLCLEGRALGILVWCSEFSWICLVGVGLRLI